MMGFLKEFHGSMDHRTDLTRFWMNSQINYPGKVDPSQNQVHLQDIQNPLKDPETSLLIQDTSPPLMTDPTDTQVVILVMKQIPNKTLMNPLRKTH